MIYHRLARASFERHAALPTAAPIAPPELLAPPPPVLLAPPVPPHVEAPQEPPDEFEDAPPEAREPAPPSAAGAPDVTPDEPAPPPRTVLGDLGDALVGLGDWTLFSLRAVRGVFTKNMQVAELAKACVQVGVSSVGVVSVTGLFIGMVLAVQAYSQFHLIGLDTSMGGVIHLSVLRELGPVLAAVMLAGRVGTAMAAQLGTMRGHRADRRARLPRGGPGAVFGGAALPRLPVSHPALDRRRRRPGRRGE